MCTYGQWVPNTATMPWFYSVHSSSLATPDHSSLWGEELALWRDPQECNPVGEWGSYFATYYQSCWDLGVLQNVCILVSGFDAAEIFILSKPRGTSALQGSLDPSRTYGKWQNSLHSLQRCWFPHFSLLKGSRELLHELESCSHPVQVPLLYNLICTLVTSKTGWWRMFAQSGFLNTELCMQRPLLECGIQHAVVRRGQGEHVRTAGQGYDFLYNIYSRKYLVIGEPLFKRARLDCDAIHVFVCLFLL